MKIRVKIPEEIVRYNDKVDFFIDEILLWGMETEMDIVFYSKAPQQLPWNSREQFAVFSVEDDYSYMFSLKFGATLHKPKEKNRETKASSRD
jgi:hypothetical protein